MADMKTVARRNLRQYIQKSGLVGPDKHSALACLDELERRSDSLEREAQVHFQELVEAHGEVAKLREAVAELQETIAEGKRQWDQVATLIGAVGDDVDDVLAKAAAVAGYRRDAELIEAARFASDVCAELYAKYQLKIGPFASQAQVANGKLRAALANLGSGNKENDNG